MASQPPRYSRDTAGICPYCPRGEQYRQQHMADCQDSNRKDPVLSGMSHGAHLRRRPSMKPLSSLLEQAPPSRALALMAACRLDARHRDFLWRQGPQEIRQALLGCDGFLVGLTESQARDILTTDDIPLLCRLASLLPGRAQYPYRLSRTTHEKLWQHLREHPDMRIREALAGNDDLPPAFGIPFADRIRQHLPFNRSIFRDLRQDDVALLLQAPYQRLVEALPFEPYISDRNVRRAFIQGVWAHKDPLVRLELSNISQRRSHALAQYRTAFFPDALPDEPAAMQDAFSKPVWNAHAAEGNAFLRLATSGKNLLLTYRQMTALAASLTPCQRELADALLGLKIPSLTETIIAGGCLSCEQMGSLWRSGGLEVRRALLGQQHFIQRLDPGQASDILKADDIPMLRQLALSMREGVRPLLPGTDTIFDRLWRHLREHPDMRVREALACNPHLSPDHAFSVSERFRQDLPFCTTAFSRLQQNELGLLFKAAHTLLLQLCGEIGAVENPSVRKNVIRYLARHPDPLVRRALASHGGTDLWLDEDKHLFHAVLMDLCEDADLRVCAAARESLLMWESCPLTA